MARLRLSATPWQPSFSTAFRTKIVPACQGVVRNAKGRKMSSPASLISYAVAVFVLNCVSNEAWWRRRESNPRPKTFHLNIYILILKFRFRRLSLLQAGYLSGYPAKVSLVPLRAAGTNYPASRRSYRMRRSNPAERWPIYAARAYS